MDKVCECCKANFTPLLTVKNQRYCRKSTCQNARKKSWHKIKLSSDNSYRENQAEAQKTWCGKHPGYWKEYRARHPAYTERNRLLQGERNRKRKRAASVIAKMDESTPQKIIPFGQYRLIPVCNPGIAKMDEWVVQIGVISAGSAPAPTGS